MTSSTCRTIATTWLLAPLLGLILGFGPRLGVSLAVQLGLCGVAIVAVVGIVVAVWRVDDGGKG